jgi:uncharacterized protein
MSFRSPGVQNQEVDSSLYSRGNSASVAGMVGVTTKGPVGVPTLITNWPQFVERFGSYRTDSYLPLAAKAFFDEGGSTLYVVRTVHYTDIADAATATATSAAFSMLQSDDLTVAMDVTALSPGTWANGLKVQVLNASGSTFDLVVKDASDNQLERFNGVITNDATSRDFVENRVNGGGSFFITVNHLAGLPKNTTVTLSGGTNGLSGLVDADYVGDPAARNGIAAFATTPTVKLIAVPGVSTTTVHAALSAYAEADGTVFAVLGSAQGATPDDVITSRGLISGGYAGLYWPWLRVRDPQTGQVIEAPNEGHVLGAIARSDSQSALWVAPAGLTRGRIRTALGVAYDSTLGERDELYEAQVNVLADFRGQGTVIWGQKTLVAKDSALDRVNVRRLLNYIKEAAGDTSRFLLFEPNDEQTWGAFVRFMEPLLENIKNRRGLYEFRVVCDATTNTPYYLDRNQMVAEIFLKPTKTAEYLLLRYIVTASDADFTEL